MSVLLLASDVTKGVDVEVDAWAVGAFLAYLALIIGIGVYSATFSSQGLTNYFIGGRKMNRLVVALSAVVSGRSAWLLLGFTGMAYSRGASALWAAAGYTIVEFFLFFFYAPRLRTFTEKYDCITLPDFFAARFGDRKGTLRILLVLVIVIFLGSYVSAQFVAGGKAFASSFGMTQTNGLLVTAAIVLFYTVLGGFLAVSLTDMIQAFFMIFALIILPVLAISDLGGWGAMMEQLKGFDPTQIDPMAITIGGLVGFLGIGLGSTGNPHILSRYMSIDDPKQLKYSAYMGTVWNILMAAGAVLVGLAGRAYFPEVSMLADSDPENIYPTLAEQQLPSILFGLVVASIFAAIMSTCDSQLLVVSSAIVRDVYHKLVHKGKELPQRQLVLYSRIVVVLLVGIALFLGFYFQEVVFWLVLFAWAGVGAAIGPISILGLFWRGTTWAGVTSGMITGTLVTILWYNMEFFVEHTILRFAPGWILAIFNPDLYELIPGFIMSILVTVIVSLCTKPPEEADEMFDSMKGKSIEDLGEE